MDNKLDKIGTGIGGGIKSDVGNKTPYKSGLSQKEDDTPARLESSKLINLMQLLLMMTLDSDVEEEVLE